jgi:hypothetical protein
VLDSIGFWVRILARTPISPRGEISQEGFSQGLVSPPATSRYIGSVRIISKAPLVCLNECWYLLKDGGLVFHNLRLHKDNKLELKKK